MSELAAGTIGRNLLGAVAITSAVDLCDRLDRLDYGRIKIDGMEVNLRVQGGTKKLIRDL
jgi:hypothetical protein